MPAAVWLLRAPALPGAGCGDAEQVCDAGPGAAVVTGFGDPFRSDLPLSGHAKAMIQTCWELGGDRALEELRLRSFTRHSLIN